MDTSKQSSHDIWRDLTTEEIHKYLDKYTSLTAPGKCSSRRRKKVKYLQNILQRREKAMRLVFGKL